MTTTLDWQRTATDFWTAGRSRIYRVNSGLYLAAANGQWLKATFVSWAKAVDAVQLTLECQAPAPDNTPPPLPQQRNFVVPGCVVDICSEEPQSVGQLLSLVFAIAQSNPNAEVNFAFQVRKGSDG